MRTHPQGVPLLARLFGPVMAIGWRLLCVTLCQLNPRFAIRVARIVVTVCVGWLRFRRLRNIRLLFQPEGWSRTQCRLLNRAAMDHLARVLVDLCRVASAPKESYRNWIAVDGEDQLQTALQQGTGAILICNHMGSFPCLFAALAVRGYRLNVAVNRLDLECLNEHFDLFARRFGFRLARVREGAARAAHRALRKNEVFCMLLDVVVCPEREVWLPFGSTYLGVDQGIAALALRHRNVPVLMATVRSERDLRATVSIQPAPTAADADTLLRRWVDWLHEEVRRQPDQWWPWSFVLLNDRVPLPARESYTTARSLPAPSQRLDLVPPGTVAREPADGRT